MSNNPQTLEEAITQAHVYVNTYEENEEKPSHKNVGPYTSTMNKSYNNNNNKQKNNNDHTMHVKKTKSFSKPLLKECFEHAKKENFYFLCTGSHPKGLPYIEKGRATKRKASAHDARVSFRVIFAILSPSVGFTHGCNA